MNKLKQKKKIKSFFQKYLIYLTFIIAMVIGASVYLLMTKGTGPFSFIVSPPRINVADSKEDVKTSSNGTKTVTTVTTRTDMSDARNSLPGQTYVVPVSTITRTVVTDNKNNIVSTSNAITDKNLNPQGQQVGNSSTVVRTATLAPGTQNPANGDISNLQNKITSTAITATTNDVAGNVVGTPQSQTFAPGEIPAIPYTPVAANTTTSTTTPSTGTCATLGSPVKSGTYVATGYGMDANGKKTSDANSPKRECVQCGGGGTGLYGNSKSCDSIVATGEPIVLPPDAGPEYTAGLTAADYSKKNSGATYKFIDHPCFADGTQFGTGGTNAAGNRCLDGAWLTTTDAFNGVISDHCKIQNMVAVDSKCVTQSNISTDRPPLTDQDKINQKAREDAQKLADAKQKCEQGGVDKFVGTTCMNPVDLGSAIRRCEEVAGKTYDLTTGKCGTQTASTTASNAHVLNQSCTDGLGTMGGQAVFAICGKNGTFPTYKFCTGGTFVSGNCVLPTTSAPATTANTPNVGIKCGSSMASKDSNGNYTSLPSCDQVCDKGADGKFASKPSNGGFYCDVPPANPNTTSTDNSNVPTTSTKSPYDPPSFNLFDPTTYNPNKNADGKYFNGVVSAISSACASNYSDGVHCADPNTTKPSSLTVRATKSSYDPPSFNFLDPATYNPDKNADGKYFNGVVCAGQNNACASNHCGSDSKCFDPATKSPYDPPSFNLFDPTTYNPNKNTDGKYFNGVVSAVSSTCASNYSDGVHCVDPPNDKQSNATPALNLTPDAQPAANTTLSMAPAQAQNNIPANLANLNITTQNGDTSILPNSKGLTVAERGCIALTAYNLMVYEQKNPNLSTLKDNTYWSCDKNGCGSNADATLLLLQNYGGHPDAVNSFNKPITDGTSILSKDGEYVYGGEASGTLGNNVPHVAGFVVKNRKVYVIDSYFNDGKTTPCEANNNSLNCGSTTYKLATADQTGGLADALYLIP